MAASIMLAACSFAQEPIKLNEPSLDRGKALMTTLSERHSVREFADRDLSLQDMSDLLWAANGINRPDEGKRTAPSAMNRQDIKVYVLTTRGAYVYNAATHTLDPVAEGDFRQGVRGNIPPVNLVLVADNGSAGMVEVNAGYVSQNIYLASTAIGLATVACGTMDEPAFRTALKLNESQRAILLHPVGYPK